ncbi:MAG: retroviral-like aspartic protease family protein [Candidatus Binatia bacterium]|nr:retroviral-like aspartic protease family protein [Candidatus Binatia bacterium]
MRWSISVRRIGEWRTVPVWRGVGCLALCLGVLSPLWAQTTIYTWTDEKGIRHYSDSAVPAQHSDTVDRIIVPTRPLSTTPPMQAVESIPLVILRNDPSQKFVRVVLEGERASREVLMLVDTGAQITLIDEDLAEELALEHMQDALLQGVTGMARGWIGRLPRLQVGAATVNDWPVMVGPLPGRLLLGMDVLEYLQLSVGPRSLERVR